MTLTLSLLLFATILSASFCDDNTFTISSASGLIDFSNNVSSGSTYSGTTVLLDADIDFTGFSDQFAPIGNSSRYFRGTFDGQGHTISNLAINISMKHVGLFGISYGTTIQNVVIDDTCSFISSYTSSYSYTGSIIGYCYSSNGVCTIENCVNMGTVAFEGNVTNYVYIGGNVGYLDQQSYTATIRNCANYGTVTHSGVSGSWTYLGGIVGYAYGKSTSYTYVQNCLNYGTTTHNGTSKTLAVGGITGYSFYSSIENCVSSGAISTNKKSNNIGAIVGYIYHINVTHCYWADNIDYNSVVGYIYSSALLSDNSAFSVTSFELSEAVSVGSSTTTSLISALNAAADHYTLRGYSHWLLNKDSHDVSFTVNNAELNITLSSQIILLPSLASRGSIAFRGWYTDNSCASLLTDYNYSGESDLSLCGKFEEDSNNYTITFDTRGGTSVSSITGQFGSVVTLPTDSTRWGYGFFRWENEYGDAVPNEFTIPAQNVTLYAVWLCARITTASDLIAFSNNVNSGITYYGATVLLDADIDFTGYSSRFAPIGTPSSNSFFGTFDGQGHTISNLVINSSTQYIGLFGYSKGTTIRNIVIDDTCSIASTHRSSYYSYIGGIVGYCYSSKCPYIITNNVNMANVTFGGNVTGIVYIGGLAGYLYQPSYTATIRNCANYGTVTQSGICSRSYLGGVIGYTYGGSASYNSYVQNCLNYGTTTHNGTSSILVIGGITGYSRYSIIDNCVSSGTISTNKKSNDIGTVVGYISGYTEITHCYWADNIGYEAVEYIDSSVLLSNNSAFSTTSFELNETATIGTSTTTSLINALNAAADHYTLRGYSHWLLNKDSHAVSFTVDNAKLNVTLTSQIILLPSIASRGTTVFRGWYTDNSCASLLTDYDYSGESDLSLYGKFEEDSNNYTITFDTRGGTSASPITGQFGDVVTLPTDSTRWGYGFFRWETEYGDAVPNEFTIPAQNITLYAVWLCARITTASDLIAFSNNVNRGANFSGTTVFLDADIDFTGFSDQFAPIGTSTDNYFCGTFDGQGHTISNLVMNISSTEFIGLFGISYGTTIRNIVIDDTCSVANSYDLEEYIIGSIIGVCLSVYDSCIIENSVNMASATLEGNTIEALIIGGIAMAVANIYYPGTIRNCVNYGSVTYSGTGDIEAIIGGITVYAYGEPPLSICIQNCANYGSIAYSSSSEIIAIGGIVGASYYSIIENCVSSGVISTNQESNFTGTIVGYISDYTEITHCYWTRDVDDFDVYGFNESEVIIANSSLVSLDQTTLDELNEYAAKNDTWSKWLMVRLNGGSINNITQESLVEIQGHFPDPVKEENKFLFWCKDAECTEVFNPKTDSVSGFTDLYAAWLTNKYTVTFDFANGTAVNATFSYNISIEYPKNNKKEGYTFNGWDSYIEYMPARDITITALWTEAVVSKSVEIVFDTKELGSKDEEELKKEVKEIIKLYTNEEFTIEGFEHNSETGETKVIIKFVDEAKAEDFVRTVNENKRSDSVFKRISIVSDDTNFSSSRTIFSSFFSLLFFV